MVTMESFAQAFGFDAKSNDTWVTLGKVQSVSGNTLSVKLGGSTSTTACEAYCLADVGDIVLVVITNGSARAVAVKGGGAFLPLTGGTLTGNLMVKHSGVDASKADNGRTSTTWPADIQGADVGGRRTSFFGESVYANGDIAAGIFAYNFDTNGDQIGSNYLNVAIKKDGTKFYGLGDAGAFRNALNVGTLKVVDISSNVSVATSTNKSIGSVSLEAGNWLVFYGLMFGGNSSGIRCAFMYTTADAGANASWYRETCVQLPPAGTSNTYLRGSFIARPSATTSYYLTAWQNSGSAINCTGNIQAMRIG